MSKYKNKSLAKKITLTLLTTTIWASFSAVGYAANLPTGGSVVDGDFTSLGTVSADGMTSTITQTSNNGVLNWNSFDVGSGYTVNFKQPDVNSMTLNKVTGNDVSNIAGNMNANGSIAIVNPNGIMFAEGSTVNAAGIVASTADIDSDSFMNGTLVFSQDNTVNGDVTVNGTLNAETNNSAVNSTLNLGGVEPATGFSTMNNVIKLVADGDVKVGTTGKLTAVTTTSLTQEEDNTIGEEEFTIGESSSSSTASGRILIRADQNADDIGTVTLENTSASQIQSKNVDIYYNTAVTSAGIAGTVDATNGSENGTSTANITGVDDTTDKYTQKDYTTYTDDKSDYKGKIATSINEITNDLATGVNSVSTDSTNTSVDVAMLVNDVYQLAAIEDGTYGNLDGEYAQGTDIDASDTVNWNGGKAFHPIGSASEAAVETKGATDGASFTGVFSGNGGTDKYSVNDLTINRDTEENVGMFSSVAGTIESVQIAGSSTISGNTNVGAIAGSLTDSGVVKWSSTGSGVTIYGKLDENDTTDTSSNIGGLVGYSNGGSITGSINNATVSALESNAVGGVIGYADNVTGLTNVYNTSTVEGEDYVGGIVGQMHNNSKVTSSVNQGEITGTFDTGGIAGLSDASSITSTYNKGIITGITNTGGIAGKAENGSKLDTVYNTNESTTLDSAVSEGSTESTTLSTYGQVTGVTNTGGLVGDLADSTIKIAYNAGNVTGTDSNTGGLVGLMEGNTSSITNAYNADNNTVIYKDGLLNAYFVYDGVSYSYSADGTTVTSSATGTSYDLNNTSDVATLESLAPETDRVSYSGLASTSNEDYNGFTYNGTEYTYSQDTGLYSDGTNTYNLNEIDSIAPVAKRVNNIRLAYKDATVTGTNNVGGLVGKVEDGSISKTYNAGKVSSTDTTTTGAIAGVVQADVVQADVNISNSYYVTDNQDNTVNLSNQTTAFGTDNSNTTISGITLAEAQSSKGNMILWGTNETSDSDNNWITYSYQTTPLLKTFMSDISISREYEYSGEYNNLKTEDVKDFYGGGFFNYSDGDGKNVLSSTTTSSNEAFSNGNSKVQATNSNGESLYYESDNITTTTTDTGTPAYWLYERETVDGIKRSIYTYDNSDLWSPQHGYLTSDDSKVRITPAELNVAITGNKVYGQATVTGANTIDDNSDAGTSYDNGYKIIYDGFVTGEDKNALEGTITYNNKGEANISYENDVNTTDSTLNAGTYTFDDSKFDTTSLTADNNNYAISYSGKLTVSKADLYIDVDGTRVYGKANKDAAYTYSADAGSNDNSNDGTLKSFDDDSLDLTGLDGWSHDEINNLESSNSVTHNGTATGNTIEYNTDVKGTSSDPEAYDLANTSDLGSGSSSNYNIIFDTDKGSKGTFTITPATLEYDVVGERIYGDANSTATGSVTANNLITGDSKGDVLNVTSENAIAEWMAETKYGLTETKNAGVYTNETLTASEATAQGISIKDGNENYVLADNADSFKFTINRAELVFDVTDKTKIYGQDNPTLTGDTGIGWVVFDDGTSESLTNVNNNGTSSDPNINMEYSTTANQQSDVGNYDIDVSSDTKTEINSTTIDDNYNITYESGNLEIKKANLNFSATGSSEYGSAPSIDDLTLKAVEVADDAEASKTNDGSLKSWDAGSKDDITTLTGFDSTDPITLITTDGNVIGKVTNVVRDSNGDVISYALANGSFKDADDNMQLSTKNYNLNFDGTDSTFTVTPKDLTFIVESQERTYGDANDVLTGSFDEDDFAGTDMITIDSSTGYVSTVSLNDNGTTVTTTDDDTIGTLVYDDSGINEKTNVNTYENKLKASGFDLNNYTVDYDYGDMKINKADLTFYVGNKDKTYGESNPGFSGGSGDGWVVFDDGTSESLTNVNNNGVSSDPSITMAYSTTANQQSDVGNYDIDVSSDTKTEINSTTIDDNYNITYESGNLEIKKANLNFSATGSSEYGSAPSIDDLTLKAVEVADDAEASKTNDGSLKSWDAGSKDDITTLTGFDSTDPITLITTDGNVIGKVTNVVRDTDGTVLSYGLADGSFKDATGAMQLSTKNYNLNFDGTDSTFTVTPKALQFAVDSATKTYGEVNPDLEGDNGIGWVNGDNLTTIKNNGVDKDVNLAIDYGTTANEKSNAGKYDITINNQQTISDTLSNYDVTYGTDELTINKAQLDFIVGDQSKTYGDVNGDLTGQFDSSDFKNGDTITVDSTGAVTEVSLNNNGSTVTDTNIGLSYNENGIDKESNAGTYDDVLTASGVNLANYEVVYTAGDMDIAQKDLVFNINNPASREYGEDNPTFIGNNGTGWVNGENLNNVNNDGVYTTPGIEMGYETSATATSNVGTYGVNTTDATKNAIDATTLNENYNITYNTNDLSVTKAQLDFVVSDQSKTYGDVNDPLTGQFDSSDFKNGDTITVDSTGAVTEVSLNNNGSTVTDTNIGLAYSANGIDSRTNAGTYENELTANGVNLTNYEVNYIAGDMDIAQKDLVFNINNPASREYGEDNPTFTGDNGTGWVNGENLNNVNNDGVYTTPGIEMGYETSATVTSNVGTYGVNTTDATKNAIDQTTLNENYNITYNTNDLSVTKAQLDFVVGDQSKTYGDVNGALTGQFDSSDFKNGDTITVDSTGAVTDVRLNNNGSTVTDTNIGLSYNENGIDKESNAGTYDDVLTASGVNLANYEVVYTAGDMDIAQKDLVFNINNPASREYGEDNPTFIGNNGTGWVNGENLNNVNNDGVYTTPGIEMGYETSATATSNVGTYGVNTTDVTKNAIDATTLNENYNITYNTNDLSVTKAQLDFVVGDQSKTYGDVNDPLTGQFDSSDFKNGDTITVDSTGAVTEVSLNNNGSTVTDTNIGLAYSANGIDSRTNAGTYENELTANGVNLTNYEVNYIAGDMDIAQKDLVFNINNPASREYGEDNPTFTGDNGTGWVNGENLNNVNNDGVYTTPGIEMGYETSATVTSNVGTYGVNTTDSTKNAIDQTTLNENYNITYNTNDLSVTKAQLDFVVGDQSKTYGDVNGDLTGQFDSSDFKNEDTITVDSTGAVTDVSLNNNGSTVTDTNIGLDYSANGIDKESNAGTYDDVLTASGVNLANYEVVYTAGDMDIAQKDLVFNINNPASREYGEDNPTFTGDNGTGWVNGENLNNVNNDGVYTTPGIEMGYETSATATSNVGTYGVNTTDATKNAIDATTLNENYNITYNTNDLSVTKAQLDFVVSDQSKTYGDVNDPLTGQFDSSDFKNGDTITVDSTGAVTEVSLNNNGSTVTDTNIGLAYSANGIDSRTNAGTYENELTANGVNLTNYEVNYIAGDMDIAQKDLVFNINNPASREYGEDNPTFTGDNGTGWVNGENLNNVNNDGVYTTPGIEMGYETSATVTSNVGTYGVNTTDATKNAIDQTTLNENYNITYNTNDLSVTKAQLDFVVGDQSKTYGDVNGALTGQFDSSDFKNGDTITVDSTGAVTDVRLNNNGSTVTDTNIGLSYNENGIDKESNAGTYDDVLTASGVNLANYEVVYTAGDMDIAQKDLTFNINSATKVYGEGNPTFTGDNGTGWVNGENLNNVNNDGVYTTPGIEMGYETSATVTSNVGTYGVNTTDVTKNAIDATTLNENYNITYDTNDLSVTKAQLDFVVSDQSKTYGDVNDPLTGQFDSSDFKNGDTITVDSTGAVTEVSLNNNGSTVTDTNIGLDYSANGIDKESNAGTYDDVLTASGVNLANYEVVYTAGDMEIDKAQLDFIVDDASKTYGDANPTFTGSFDTTTNDFKNGDSITVDSDGGISSVNLNDNGSDITNTNSTQVSGLKYESDATQYSDANEDYYIKADGFDLTNYDVNYTNGDLDIGKADLTYTVDSLTKEYGEDPTYTGTYDGLKGENDTTNLGGLTPDITGADQQSDVGSYDLDATFDEDVISDNFKNYNLTTESGTITITPADLYFNAEGERDYGVDSDVNDFTYSASKGVSDTTEGALKTWDSSSEDDLATLKGFTKNGTDDLILWTEVNGTKTQIGTVTDVKFDSNNNIVGYELADGSFTRADGSNQLGSLNYNWIFEGGSYTVNELPISGEPEYKETASLANSMGGFREPNDIASILYLKVVDNGINIAGNELNYYDTFNNLMGSNDTEDEFLKNN